MIGQVDRVEKKAPIRIAGYLEKRGKMRMLVCRWRRWWFVLEGRLLLYYKSSREYELSLSPCRGTVNLGLASCVRPGRGLELTVVMRSQTVTLRAVSRTEHERWLQSLVNAMAVPHCPSSASSIRPVNHFRYAKDNQHYVQEWARTWRQASFRQLSTENGSSHLPLNRCRNSLSSSNSSGLAKTQSEKCMLKRVFSESKALLRRPSKRNPESNNVRLSKIAFSDTSIPATLKPELVPLSKVQSREKCHSLQDLRDRLEESETPPEEREGDLSENGEPPTDSIKIELSLEGIGVDNGKYLEEPRIGRVKIVVDGCVIYGKREVHNPKMSGRKVNSKSDEALPSLTFSDKLDLINARKTRSDSSLAERQLRRHSSCDQQEVQDRSIGSTFFDNSSKIDVIREERRRANFYPHPSFSISERKPKKKRSHSFLTKIRDGRHVKCEKPEKVGESLERQGSTIKKRLSFLKKIWRKKERKLEEDFEVVDYEEIPVVIELPSPEVLMMADKFRLPMNGPDDDPEPEPPPDYDLSLTEEVEQPPPTLPPRLGVRPASPEHDVPRNNRPVAVDPPPPPLPAKRRQPRARLDRQLSEIAEELLPSATDSAWPTRVPKLQLPEPVYDVPRRHHSLLATLARPLPRSDSFAPTHFLCAAPLEEDDSLDLAADRLEEMTPDSLECESTWSLAQASPSEAAWTHSFASDSDSLRQNYFTSDETRFRDSLSS